MYEEATSDVVISTLKECFKKYGKPEKILTDNRTQFVPARGGVSKFQKFLLENRILHIRTSVRHPQTIGKVERINREWSIDYICRTFASIFEYNDIAFMIRYFY
ncbi:Integrase catalytic region, partial [Methanotorris formicicus Mc-S-70]